MARHYHPAARHLLRWHGMTLKKFLVLGSVLAGAAVLANRDRRERLLRSSRNLLENARKRLEARREPIDIGTGTGANVTTATDYPTPTL